MEKSGAYRLWESFHKLGKQMHRYDIRQNHALFMLLHMIHGLAKENGGKVNVSHIAEICGKAMAATSKAIRRLENEGYIERSTDDRDRRVVYISLTDAGEKTYREMLYNTNRDFTRLVRKWARRKLSNLSCFWKS